jgi:hypothetical protein
MATKRQMETIERNPSDRREPVEPERGMSSALYNQDRCYHSDRALRRLLAYARANSGSTENEGLGELEEAGGERVQEASEDY